MNVVVQAEPRQMIEKSTVAEVTDGVGLLRRTLLAARNRDGGWPYYAGKASRLEPTCWALLALGAADPRWPGGVETLRAWPRDNGLLREHERGQDNAGFTGLAALTFMSLGGLVAETTELVEGLVRLEGIQLAPSPVSRQDNSLQGWPWVEGTFSWVEPTAYCLLALKKFSRTWAQPDSRISARIEEAERLLLDRVCVTGGWNYGNANVLGASLRAYIPTTALGVLALQDRRDHPAVERSLSFLSAKAHTEKSSRALGLALLCATIQGRSTTLEQHLAAQVKTTVAVGNLAWMGVALYALDLTRHQGRAFQL